MRPTGDPCDVKDELLIDGDWMDDMHRVWVGAKGMNINFERSGHCIEIVVTPPERDQRLTKLEGMRETKGAKWYCEICGHEFYDPKWLVDSDENETPYCPECESININLKESIQKIKEALVDE